MSRSTVPTRTAAVAFWLPMTAIAALGQTSAPAGPLPRTHDRRAPAARTARVSGDHVVRSANSQPVTTRPVRRTTPARMRAPRTPLSPRPIQELLDTRVPFVEFENVPLEDVADWLADYTGLLVYVRWGVLQDVGIGRNTLINLKARERKLSQILWVVMNEAAGARPVKVAYEASDDLLVLSTHDDLNGEMVTRVYPVSSLIQDIPKFYPGAHRGPNAPPGDSATEGIVYHARLRRHRPPGEVFGSRNPVGSDDRVYTGRVAPHPVTTDPRLVELMDLITYTVEPESWEVNGLGGHGRIYPSQEMLIIRNSRYVHEMIENTLLRNDRRRKPRRMRPNRR